jgi:radical SAM family uncharacterized protein/radical SAM-linked protein
VNLLHFQKPSRYIDREINVLRKEGALKVALAFPDIYDVGMSHLGLKVLYDIVNRLPFASAERAFHPWLDMEEAMKREGVPLRSLESGSPLVAFDVVGFSLQCELSYTSVLNMLSLGGIPLRSEDRTGAHPVVLAGGPCTVNPAPMSPFVDAFLVGDGEEAVPEMLEAVHRHGPAGRHSVLEALAAIEGVYVPALTKGAPVRRRFIPSLEDSPFPECPVVPYTEIVHDRINIEVSRGCTRGCRFCQAGMIYRPLRERSPERVLEIAQRSLACTGHEEVAFTSLSAGDYSQLLPLLKRFNRKFSEKMLSVSLPSLRVGAVSEDLLREIRAVRKSGFTIAPEAATPRLRAVINKDFSEEDYERAVEALFREGWQNLKLYFMIGLPTERDEDIEAIAGMVKDALKAAKRHTRRFVNINVSVSPFVPKSHTPFQWHGQEDVERIRDKKDYLRGALKKISIKGHDERMSMLEAAFARGDERLGALVEAAWREGARLDGWTEAFDFEAWLRAMGSSGLDAFAYARREFGADEALPWDVVDTGVKKEYLRREYEKAAAGRYTADCREHCTACGLGCEPPKPAEAHPEPPVLRPLRAEAKAKRPIRVRARFSKTGMLRYLSHRELITHITRAIRRAGVDVDYSKGFNPSPKIAFGPPLGVGVAGLREYFDMEVFPGMPLRTIMERLNAALAEEVRIDEVAPVGMKEPSLQEFVTRYAYEVMSCPDHGVVEEFMGRDHVTVVRKKGTVDIRPMVEEASAIGPGRVRLLLRDREDKKVRLDEIVQAVFGRPSADLEITRTGVFGYRGGWVEPLEGEGRSWQAASS